MGASTNSLAFKKPLSDEKLQTRKNEQGQWLVRCAKCRSQLGSLVGGKNPHYRITAAETNFEEDDFDVEMPEFEKGDEKKEGEKDKNVRTDTPMAPLSAATLFVAGSVVGGIVGATAAFLICRNLEEPLVASNIEATTTSLSTSAATSQDTQDTTRPTPPPSPIFTPLPTPGTSPSTGAAATSSGI